MDQAIGTPTTATDNLHYAGFWARLGAGVVDFIILVFCINIAEGLAYGLVSTYSSAFANALAGLIANLGVVLVYYLICLIWKHRTIGQWIFRQIVVLPNGAQLTSDVAASRSAWVLITYLFAGLPFLTILFSSKKQTLHDKMAGTVVVRK